MRRIELFILIPFLLLFIFPLASAADETSENIRIGSILILSGQGAAWGNAAKNGIEMAVDDLNKAGGILGRKVTVIHQDDQGDPKKGIAAFRQLTEFEKVKFIIGPNWSNVGLSLVDMANRGKIVMVSPSLGLAKFNESGEMLFNTWPHDYILSRLLADFVYKKGHRNIALVGAEDVWVKEQTTAFKTRFQELGGRIAFITEPLPSTTDLRTEALKIKNTPDVDAFVSTTDGVVLGSMIAKILKELKVSLPLYSITIDQQAIDVAEGGFEGLEFLTFLTPTSEFKKQYEERFKTSIDIGADSAYDAVMMIAQSMQESKTTDPEAVAKQLSKITNYRGVSGNLISDGKRAFTKEYAVKKIINGKPSSL